MTLEREISPRPHYRRNRHLCRIAPLLLCVPVIFLAIPADTISYPLQQYDRSEQIAHLSTETRYALRAIQYLLTPEEFNELISQRHDFYIHRWIEEYWKLKDPIFTTEENEALREHERRIEYAEKHFEIRKWPMWDQRGEIYIRYGPPSFRQIIPAEVSPLGMSPPGELWYYRQYDMYILFEDAASSGEYTYYQERVKGPPSIRMEKIGDTIDQVSSKNLGVIPAPSIAYESAGDAYRKKLRKFEEIIETSPASYWFNFKENQLPFVFSVDNFRAGENLNRVEINIEFLANMSWRKEPPPANDYLASAVFWNTDRTEVQRKQQRLSIPLAAGAADSSRLMPTQLVLSVPPGFYFAAVTLEEIPSNRIASYRKEITCYDFDRALAISDIIFASKIEPTSKNSLFNRGAIEVVPHPIRRYRYPAPVPVYFELYNLALDERGIASYDVSYRIVSTTPRKVGFWDRLRGKKSTLDVTSSFHSSNPGSTDQVHITLGSENLWAGTFNLEVSVIDLNSNQVVTRPLSFDMIE